MTESARGRFTVDIAGRTVIVRTGSKSQTVNVCTAANVAGTYETRFRLPIVNAITDEADLDAPGSLDELRTWLLERNATEEGPSGEPAPLPELIGIDAGDPWARR